MGPETTAHLTLYRCPAEQVRAVVAVLDEFDLVQGADVVRGQLTLDATYYAHEVDLTTLTQITARMLTAAPGTTWAAYAPAAESEPGEYVLHDPVLGTWRARCDVDGEPTLPVTEVRAGRAQGALALDVVLGAAWADRVDELRRTTAARTVTAAPAGYRAVWENGTVTVDAATGGNVVLAVPGPADTAWQDVDTAVDEQLAPTLATAGFVLIPGTWVTAEHGIDPAIEGEVLAQTPDRYADANDHGARRQPVRTG